MYHPHHHLLQKDPRMSLPVVHISIHCDIDLTRVRQQEHNRNILLYGCCGSANKVEVIEEPRKGCKDV